MAGKKVGNKSGFAELKKKAAKAQAKADGLTEDGAPTDAYMADLALAMQQETAFMEKPDKPYDHSAEVEFLGQTKTFYWKVQGAGVAGRYIDEMAKADVGELFVKMVFYRPVSPETGEPVFSHNPDLLVQFRDNPAYTGFVTNLAALIFESDINQTDRLQAKVDAAKKK